MQCAHGMFSRGVEAEETQHSEARAVLKLQAANAWSQSFEMELKTVETCGCFSKPYLIVRSQVPL